MDASIGDLFRNHGEDYIRIYKPPGNHIKLIRSIRVCRTPALGGKAISCDDCGHTKYIHLSCGNSQCPLCQNQKRNIWQEKLTERFLNVPYVHSVFTIAHELNKLARLNKQLIYDITMRAAWQTVKTLARDEDNVGGLPGMVAVLHTFGSDMKYHIHVHALITFGGVDENGNWKWPKRKKRIASFRAICRTYRDTFMSMLEKEIRKGNVVVVDDIEELLVTVKNKSWNVRNEYPTADTTLIERYLARYINRIAISKSRLKYIAKNQGNAAMVEITYKDYRRKVDGQAAPTEIESVEPLATMHQFLQHVLPPYFQKSRFYGIHHGNTFKRIKSKLSTAILRNTQTIKVLMQLISILFGLKQQVCESCGGGNFSQKPLRADPKWIFNFITIPSYRGPPRNKPNIDDLY